MTDQTESQVFCDNCGDDIAGTDDGTGLPYCWGCERTTARERHCEPSLPVTPIRQNWRAKRSTRSLLDDQGRTAMTDDAQVKRGPSGRTIGIDGIE
jgi:hypothetical protein